MCESKSHALTVWRLLQVAGVLYSRHLRATAEFPDKDHRVSQARFLERGSKAFSAVDPRLKAS